MLTSQLDSYTQQVNASIQLINNGINYYFQRIERLEDSIDPNRVTVDQINNNLTNEPHKFTFDPLNFHMHFHGFQ